MILIHVIVLVSLLTWTTEGLPTGTDGNTVKIIGGYDAPLGSVPYQISWMYYRDNHVCGGSIIDEWTILTAARCCSLGTASVFNISAGVYDLAKPENEAQLNVRVSSTLVHPEYNSWTMENDICIAKLRTPLELNPFRRTAAVRLPRQGKISRGMVTVTGWGATIENGNYTNKLQAVRLPIVTDSECQRYYSDEQILPSMICAGYPEGGRDTCRGDAGGPLVDDDDELVGITSWAYGCARPGYPGVSTKVSAYVDWINANRI